MKCFRTIMGKIKSNLLNDTKRNFETLLILVAKQNIDRINNLNEINNIQEVEFRVFSQFGEDGIIQFLNY